MNLISYFNPNAKTLDSLCTLPHWSKSHEQLKQNKLFHSQMADNPLPQTMIETELCVRMEDWPRPKTISFCVIAFSNLNQIGYGSSPVLFQIFD